MLFGYAGMLFHRKMRHYKEYKRPWKTSFFLIICKACYFLSNGIKWEYHINNILKKYFFKKEYLIEAHYYVKGLFNLHVPDCVKPSSIPKFGLCSEETGSTNQKNLNIQTFPQTPTIRRHQRFCLCIYHILVTTKGCQAQYFKDRQL